MPYTAKDFALVCRVGVISYVLVVNATLGVKTVEQLVSAAKKARDPIPHASPVA
jgi:tripartite-type tricarboxylate transporter receptor subunit TctC